MCALWPKLKTREGLSGTTTARSDRPAQPQSPTSIEHDPHVVQAKAVWLPAVCTSSSSAVPLAGARRAIESRSRSECSALDKTGRMSTVTDEDLLIIRQQYSTLDSKATCAAVMLYDYVLTIRDEVNLIWVLKKPNSGTVIYVLNRLVMFGLLYEWFVQYQVNAGAPRSYTMCS
ncbi:uncharacterized protein C8Q71DRAFT_391419 [Rhodofomes roseus]|uniref:DUF6533 domain-containing protein n=1 Tax=Rhodofomes roseus TaxID=34475 RepID=A0ABQ8JZU8_9APHY|nr:uncharacterized protein C8Q71DRAFT_391419 [Rhodofomes roseus]KAH9829859.1 hypothetical protein C8Q71DRAFT_391419 [Rhodofomes roseus]